MNQIQVRPGGPADTAELAALVAGLSPRSAFLRFFAGVGNPTARLVAALLRRDADHGAWVCATAGGLLGHASWARDGDAAEVGVVVTDGWQGRGLGRALLVAALHEAAGQGLAGVRLHVHAEHAWLVRRVSAGADNVTRADGVVTVTRPMTGLLARPAAAGLVA